MNKIQPLKRFGQNYLKDRNILNKIINEINPVKEDFILEIGPGYGILTEELLKRTDNFMAVEIDKRVIDELKNKLPGIKLINEDFLKINLESLYNLERKKLRVAGNIPYNITSPIIFKLIKHNAIVEDAVFMVQYEVARRMTADKGSKDYGILAVVLKYFTKTKLCFKVSPNVFFPKPKVDSAVIHIIFKDKLNKAADDNLFIDVVKAAFGNRRKTLKNSINNSIFGGLSFESCSINFSKRAEELDLIDFIELTNFIHGKLNG